jgi:hypothetical protein
MSSLQNLQRFVVDHRDELVQAAEKPSALDQELRNLTAYWDQEDEEQVKLDETWRVLRHHPSVIALLAHAGLVDPAQPRSEANRGTSAPPARQPTPARTDGTVSQAPSPCPADASLLWNKKLVIGKEIVTGVLAVLIVLVTLVVAVVVILKPGDDAAQAAAKDGLLFLNGLVGVVLGYYFGRVPGDARADRAEDQAQQAQSERDQTLGEVRGVLETGGVALDRAGTPAGVTLSAEQVARLRELIRR